MPADRSALLELSAAIQSTRELETLEKKLLEIVSRTLYADRGAILLLGETGEQFASVCGWDSHEERNRPASYSRAIIDRDVLIPRGALIGYNPEEDRRRHTVSESGVVIVTIHIALTQRG